MAQHDPLEKTDYRLHTDEELRDAIGTAQHEQSRLVEEGSEEALDAARRQQQEMEAELQRRGRS